MNPDLCGFPPAPVDPNGPNKPATPHNGSPAPQRARKVAVVVGSGRLVHEADIDPASGNPQVPTCQTFRPTRVSLVGGGRPVVRINAAVTCAKCLARRQQP